MADRIKLIHEKRGATLEDAGLAGVNAGPMVGDSGTGGFKESLSNTYRDLYKDLQVNSVRTHDFYSRFDLDSVFDIGNETYNWDETDRAFKYIISSGARPYFRIGYSFDAKASDFDPLNTSANRALFCQAALALIGRYQEAGFISPKLRHNYKNKIKYVEIWNEPDHSRFWPQTEDEVDKFVTFFFDILRAIRKNYPEIKVGGPGFTQEACNDSMGKKIISCMIAQYETDPDDLYLDFFSWHCYSISPDFYQKRFQEFSSKAAHKLGTKVHHITEWNRTIDKEEDEQDTITQFEVAALTACWIRMNKKGIHAAHFYRGIDPVKGILNERNGKEQAIAYAFRLWSRFADLTKGGNNLYEVTGEKTDTTLSWNVNHKDRFYGLGAYGTDLYAMLLVNVSKDEDEPDGDVYHYKISTPRSSDRFSTSDIKVYKVTQGGVSLTDDDLEDRYIILRRNAIHLVVVDL